MPAAGVSSGEKDKLFARLTGSISTQNKPRNSMFQMHSLPIISSNTHEDLHEIEHELSKYQLEKLQLEDEYNKIPTSFRKSFSQKEKKDALKTQIDELNKHINEAKMFIRKKRMEKDRSFL